MSTKNNTTSVAERIAALQHQSSDSAPPPVPIPKTNKSDANLVEGRISALKDAMEVPRAEKPKHAVGKLKLPTGGIPIIKFGAPPPHLAKKQHEREERMKTLQLEANSADCQSDATQNVGQATLPAGAVPTMPGQLLSPSILKKQKEQLG